MNHQLMQWTPQPVHGEDPKVMSEESDADRLHKRALELREELDRRVADDWDTIKDLTFDGPNDAAIREAIENRRAMLAEDAD